MSVSYSPILWNKQKQRYDRVLGLGILLLVPVFIGIPILVFCLVFFFKPFNDHRFE